MERKRTVVKGEVLAEIFEQTLKRNEHYYTTVKGDETVSTQKLIQVNAKVIAVDNAGNKVGSAKLVKVEDKNGTTRYRYNLVITGDKTASPEFSLYIEVFYGADNKLVLKDFPTKIKNDGATHVIQSNDNKIPQVDLHSDVATVSPSVSVIEKNNTEIEI